MQENKFNESTDIILQLSNWKKMKLYNYILVYNFEQTPSPEFYEASVDSEKWNERKKIGGKDINFICFKILLYPLAFSVPLKISWVADLLVFVLIPEI